MERRGARGGRGRLTREDLRLWAEVAKTVRRRPGAAMPPSPPEPPARAAEAAPDRPPAPPRPSPPTAPRVLPLAPLEKNLRRRLTRGQLPVDMKIDLHGLRQDEAHAALRDFLARARRAQARLVLVVTGKGGRRSEDEAIRWSSTGVLRRAVPLWLAAPELRALVLGFEEASAAHGGAGALYVRLRAARRKEDHS